MEASFISQNNAGFGSFISSFNMGGQAGDELIKTGYLVNINIKTGFVKEKSRVLNIRIENLSSNKDNENNEDNEFDTEITMLWVNVPIPSQSVMYSGDKVYFNNHFSGLDLIRKICYFDGKESNYKRHSRLTYKLELQNLLGSEFDSFHDKYLDLTKRPSFQNSCNNETPAESLYFPIFFRPHLKTFLVKSGVIRIEIYFNEISKLFTKSPRVFLNSYNLDKASCTLVAKHFNDPIIREAESCIFETETSFQNILPLNVQNLDADKNNLKRFVIDFKEKDLLVNNIIFAMDDQSFSNNYLFYGRTVNESIKCYLNSCFCLVPTTDCIQLSELVALNINGWSAQVINANNILLSFRQDQNIYQTLLVSKKIPFENLDQVYINLQVSPKIHLYWFKKIELDFDYYDRLSHVLTHDKFNGGRKVLNGQFKIEKENLSDGEKSLVFMGVERYCFNYNILTDWKNPRFKENLDQDNYLTQKHFDVYFSLPVHSKQPSPFAGLDFLNLNYCDYNWMDLDRKHEWEIEKITISSNLDKNFSIEFTRDMLRTMQFSQPFNLPQLTITTPKMIGYNNFKNYLATVEYRNSEFFEIKHKDLALQTEILNCIISKFEYFCYQNLKYQKIGMDKIKKIYESENSY